MNKIINISGGNIKRFREEKGISRGELAERMRRAGRKITEAQLGEMENGTRKIYDFDLMILSGLLCRGISELLDDE